MLDFLEGLIVGAVIAALVSAGLWHRQRTTKPEEYREEELSRW